MRLSLYTIVEELNLPPEAVELKIPFHHFYQCVRVRRKKEAEWVQDCVYLADRFSEQDKTLPDTSCMIYCENDVLPDGITCCSLKNAGEITEILNRVLEVFDRYQQYEAKILDMLRWQRSMQEIITLLSQVFQSPVYLLDSSFRVLAIDENPDLLQFDVTWKRMRERGYMHVDTVRSLMRNPNWKKMEDMEAPTLIIPGEPEWPEFYTSFINCNIRISDRVCAHFFVLGTYRNLTPGMVDLAGTFAEHLAEGLMLDDFDPDAKGNYYEHFLNDVMAGTLKDRELIQEQLTPMGWQMEDTYCVLAVDSASRNHSFVHFLANRLDYFGGKTASDKAGMYCVFCVQSSERYQYLIQQLGILFRHAHVACGLSMCFSGFAHLGRYRVQGRFALEWGKGQRPEEMLHVYRDYIMEHIFSVSGQAIPLGEACEYALELLEKADNRFSAHYYDTLYAYLVNERSLIRTAEALKIHRNTLLNRISRIEKLTGADLDDPDQRFRLLLSYKIKEFLKENKPV